MLLVVLMVLVVCFTVFTRYFLSYTPSWGEETALLCMVWFGFLSMALGVRDDLHLSITILDRVTPKFMEKAVALFKYICTFSYGFFMLRLGYRMVQVGRMNDMPGLGLSSGWLYAAVPIAGTANMVYSIEKFYAILTNRKIQGVTLADESEGGLQ